MRLLLGRIALVLCLLSVSTPFAPADEKKPRLFQHAIYGECISLLVLGSYSINYELLIDDWLGVSIGFGGSGGGDASGGGGGHSFTGFGAMLRILASGPDGAEFAVGFTRELNPSPDYEYPRVLWTPAFQLAYRYRWTTDWIFDPLIRIGFGGTYRFGVGVLLSAGMAF